MAGFRFGRHVHTRGSILCLPSGIYGWDANEGAALTPALFEKVMAETLEIEFLLVGTGMEIRPLPADLKAAAAGPQTSRPIR